MRQLQHTIVIEKTCKRFKVAHALSTLGIVAAAFWAFCSWVYGRTWDVPPKFTASIVVLVLSLCVRVYATVGKWWHND